MIKPLNNINNHQAYKYNKFTSTLSHQYIFTKFHQEYNLPIQLFTKHINKYDIKLCGLFTKHMSFKPLTHQFHEDYHTHKFT